MPSGDCQIIPEGLFYVRTRARDRLCLPVIAAIKPFADNLYDQSRFDGYE